MDERTMAASIERYRLENFGQTATYISSKNGEIFAIVHAPEKQLPKSCAVIMINSGLQNRAGPQRLYAKSARQFASLGFTVVRVDMPGVGDSFGKLQATHFDTYDPDDVKSIIDYVVDVLNIDELVLLGLCAGARVAAKAAAFDNRVNALVAWGMPLYSAPPDMPQSPEIVAGGVSSAGALDNLSRWRTSIFKPRVWRGFFAAGGDFGFLIKRIGTTLRQVIQPAKKRSGKRSFISAIEKYVADERPVLFVYGAFDRAPLAEFKAHFTSIANGEKKHFSEVGVVENAGHTFRDAENRIAVIRLTSEWLIARFS